MLKNYIKIAYRNLLKNKGASFVNIFGLSVAVGCSIVAYLFVDMHFSRDAFHLDADRIFLVEQVIERDGAQQRWGTTPVPLGPALARDFPQVERSVRVQGGGGVVRAGDKVFQEGFWFVDPGFLEMFTFPLKYGRTAALKDQDALILSEGAALRFFGDRNPVGEEVTVKLGEGPPATFIVQGVTERIPQEASFTFNILLPYERQAELGANLGDWGAMTLATFVQVRQPEDVRTIAPRMDRYLALQRTANEDWKVEAFRFDNLRLLSRHSSEVWSSISSGMHVSALVALPLVAVFLLALSCFNYMNIAVASAARRLKEIGVRKAMGSSRLQLVGQFVGENVLLCALALGLGVILARFVLLPQFNTFFLFWPQLGLSLAEDWSLWLFLLALLALTAVASGAYPAFYIASFEAVRIFRGKGQLGGRKAFTRTLLAFQFILAFLTMLISMVMVQNARYQSDRDWGYDQEHVLVVPLERADQYGVMEQALARHPDVVEVAGSRHHLMGSDSDAVLEVAGEKVHTKRYEVGFGYLEALGVRLRGGRLLDPNHSADADRSLVVNETFVRERGLAEPVGQAVRLDGAAYTIVGVVEDFHHYPFFDPIRPVVFTVSAPETYAFLMVRLREGTGRRAAQDIRETWREHFPDAPYTAFFQDTVFDSFYVANNNLMKILWFTATMALLLSCMGLFGLVSQHIARRTKEIGIRKVLGAGTASVAVLVNRSFLLLLVLAASVATPAAYFLLQALLDSLYPSHIDLAPGPFLAAYALVFGTAVLTMATQLRKIVQANPSEILRTE